MHRERDVHGQRAAQTRRQLFERVLRQTVVSACAIIAPDATRPLAVEQPILTQVRPEIVAAPGLVPRQVFRTRESPRSSSSSISGARESSRVHRAAVSDLDAEPQPAGVV
jgi:hypothetical protein